MVARKMASKETRCSDISYFQNLSEMILYSMQAFLMLYKTRCYKTDWDLECVFIYAKN